MRGWEAPTRFFVGKTCWGESGMFITHTNAHTPMQNSETKHQRLIMLKKEVLAMKDQGLEEISIRQLLTSSMLQRWGLGYRTRMDYLEALEIH